MADYSTKAPGVYVEQVSSGSAPISGVGTSTAGFVGVVPNTIKTPDGNDIAKVGEVRLVTNFTEFKNSFGDFSADTGQSLLAHAVYGFFLNGGTRCWVTRVAPPAPPAGSTDGKVDYATVSLTEPLALFEPIDEIALVAAPGLSSKAQTGAISDHCKKVGNRFGVLDTAEKLDNATGQPDFAAKLAKGSTTLPDNTDYAALYFPWIQVQDPATKAPKFVAPSGHVIGMYARVDAQRGVHKAPANETLMGVLDTRYAISRAHQEGLNAHGVNCIRRLNGNIRVWGARTVGGSDNVDYRYVNVRRLFLYLRDSIDQGTQWAVFEPNNPDLWAKITRNVSAFLNNVWASGALFGSKPEEAFFVKCDAETNPASLRDIGQVTTEIGVAITKPAEFVVFKLGQGSPS